MNTPVSSPLDLDALARQAGQVTDPTPDRLLAGRRQLRAAIDQADTRVAALRRARRRSSRRWVVSALAGAAAVAATVLVVPLATAPSASAEQVLLVTARAAGEQPDRTAGAAYWYVRSEVDYPETEPFEREIWQGRSGDGVLRDGGSAAGLNSDGVVDPARLRTESLDRSSMFVVGGDPLSWQDLEGLPTDPDRLGALLQQKVTGFNADAEFGESNALWEGITGLLRESPASPALRQALWEVAARMPDVELVGPMTDAVGRPGTAIERDQRDQGWHRVVYILDPATGALLETRDVDEDGDVVFRLTELVQEPRATAPAAQPPLCGPGSVPERSC